MDDVSICSFFYFICFLQTLAKKIQRDFLMDFK
jgi:hypothetical protein